MAGPRTVSNEEYSALRSKYEESYHYELMTDDDKAKFDAAFDQIVVPENPENLDSGEPTDTPEPTNPTEPTDPTKPTEPTNPTEPTDPTKPTEPTNPTGNDSDNTDPGDAPGNFEFDGDGIPTTDQVEEFDDGPEL